MKQIGTQIVILMMIFFMVLCAHAGDLEPPVGSPGSTMKTLDEIPPSWHQILSASERFKEVMGGEAVLDKETGLVWAKNSNRTGPQTWNTANYLCLSATIGNRKGWRMPTAPELLSLLDMSISGSPKVPAGVFINMQSGYYWSDTAYYDTDYAWIVRLTDGHLIAVQKDFENEYFFWPVRGGSD